MAEKKLRRFNIKNIEDVPALLTRLSNYVIEGKITTQQANVLLASIRTFLQWDEHVHVKEDISHIQEQIDELKKEGLL